MINRWAPSNENDTKAYINYIVNRTGITANQLITKGDKDRLVKIVEALADYENSGKAPDIKQVVAGWNLLAFNTWSEKKKVAAIGAGSILIGIAFFTIAITQLTKNEKV